MQIAQEGGMTVLIDETVRFLGVPIFGINFRQNKKMDEIEKLINESISPEHPSIVLNHEPVFHNLLSKAGAFLVVSGHTHNGQFWPGNILTRLFYGKYTYGINILGDLTSITTSGVGTWGPPIRTFNTPEIVLIEFKGTK
jgi:predicted MPP superfamily phosphohydrolase